MSDQRQRQLPRWALATLAGAACAGLLFALFRLGFGFDAGVSALLGGALGLCVGLVAGRQLSAAGVVLGALEITVSAAVTVLSIIAAILSAFA
jgi:hypothetical protein